MRMLIGQINRGGVIKVPMIYANALRDVHIVCLG